MNPEMQIDTHVKSQMNDLICINYLILLGMGAPNLGVQQLMTLLRLQTSDDGRPAVVASIANFNTAIRDAIWRKAGAGAEQAFTPRNACLLMQDVIKQKFAEMLGRPSIVKQYGPQKFVDRLAYFTSDQFIEALLRPIPYRTKFSQSIQQTSYESWFNAIFQAEIKGWREESLVGKSNQAQCLAAMKMPAGTRIRDLQDRGGINCYICGKTTEGPALSTMECEHILPIITALSHWWLFKQENNEVVDVDNRLHELLAYEYGWSHECCNQRKSNVDFIMRESVRGRANYTVNAGVIRELLMLIKRGGAYDCDDIPGIDAMNPDSQTDTIIRGKILPLIDNINKNMSEFDDFAQYEMFTKLKVLSALSDESFLQALLADTETVNFALTPAEKAKQTRIENAIAAAAAIAGERERMESARQAAKAARASRAAMKGGGKDMWEIPVALLNKMVFELSNGAVQTLPPGNNISVLFATYIQFNPAFSAVFNDPRSIEMIADYFVLGLQKGLFDTDNGSGTNVPTGLLGKVPPKRLPLSLNKYRKATRRNLRNLRGKTLEEKRLWGNSMVANSSMQAGGYSNKTRKNPKNHRINRHRRR